MRVKKGFGHSSVAHSSSSNYQRAHMPGCVCGLQLERSFKNIRGDIFDRSPAQVDMNDILCFTDYDVARFHRTQVPAHRLSLTSPASISSASQQLLYEVRARGTLRHNCAARLPLPERTRDSYAMF